MQDVAEIDETSTMKENLTNQQNIIKELFKNNIQVKIFSIKVSLMLVVKFMSNQPSRAAIDQCQIVNVQLWPKVKRVTINNLYEIGVILS